MIEEQLVELGPRYLEGLGGPGLALAEVERVLEPRFLIVERCPVLVDEAMGADAVQHAQALEHRQVSGQQRLADVEAWEALALRHRHRQPAAGEEGGRGGAARTAAHHEHVVVRWPARLGS